MNNDLVSRQSAGAPGGGTTSVGEYGMPGKRTLVEQAQTPAVQMHGNGNGESSEAGVHTAAARGVATPGSPLPFGDKIQKAFGHHDISSVQAHTGPDAAHSAKALGAHASAA